MRDPFGGILSEFFGAGPIPPESVARNVLGIGMTLPLNRPGIKAAFRFQVKLLRPDLPESAADALRREDAEGDTTTRLAELLWARDDLLRRVKDPVTGDGLTTGQGNNRNDPACKCCQDRRRNPQDKPWRKLHWPNRWAG